MAAATRFCLALEKTRVSRKSEFVAEMLGCLPRLYILFSETEEETPENDNLSFMASYVDEDYYESIRRSTEALLGPDDTFLETLKRT